MKDCGTGYGGQSFFIVRHDSIYVICYTCICIVKVTARHLHYCILSGTISLVFLSHDYYKGGLL